MGLSKRLEEARKGFASGNTDLSASAHDPASIKASFEKHSSPSSQYIGSMVYGGLDGIITTFAVVSGVAGAALAPQIIIILGLANVFADGFSMATGAYLSEKSENEYYLRERQREAWEVEHFPEGEKEELYQLYLEQGYPEEDARQMVEIKARDHKRWVDAMMLEELKLMPSESNPMTSALVTFGAFIIAGMLPMLVYLLDWILPFSLAPSDRFLSFDWPFSPGLVWPGGGQSAGDRSQPIPQRHGNADGGRTGRIGSLPGGHGPQGHWRRVTSLFIE